MNDREKKHKIDEFFMSVARLFAVRSHCVSIQVGAVCVRDERIIATGINGTPSGYVNCDDKFSAVFDKNTTSENLVKIKEEHHDWSSLHEIHAEMNVILYAARHGIKLDGATLYSTVEPCIYCTKNLMQSGINRIVYDIEYYRNVNNKELQDFIKKNKRNIKFEKLNGGEWDVIKR